MRAIAVAFSLLAIVPASAASNDPPGPFPAIKNWNTVVITLHHGCGRAPPTCPIYEVTIFGDGEVTFHGARAVKAMGDHTFRVSRAAVRGLVAKFRSAKFFMLSDGRIMDSASRVSIAFDDHYRSIPGERASRLSEAIEKTTGAARLIGIRE